MDLSSTSQVSTLVREPAPPVSTRAQPAPAPAAPGDSGGAPGGEGAAAASRPQTASAVHAAPADAPAAEDPMRESPKDHVDIEV
jgi:hypothetical protein